MFGVPSPSKANSRLTPSSFTNGLQAHQVLKWRVVRSLTPLTRSCVLLAELVHNDKNPAIGTTTATGDALCATGTTDAAISSLPRQVILKVYDRRYQEERLEDEAESWTWETERHARTVWLARAEVEEKAA